MNVLGQLASALGRNDEQPDAVLAELSKIIAAADKGSVIAKDKAVAILVKLAAAGHGGKALPVIDAAHRAAFVRLLEARLATIEASAKRTRVEKVLRRAKA